MSASDEHYEQLRKLAFSSNYVGVPFSKQYIDLFWAVSLLFAYYILRLASPSILVRMSSFSSEFIFLMQPLMISLLFPSLVPWCLAITVPFCAFYLFSFGQPFSETIREWKRVVLNVDERRRIGLSVLDDGGTSGNNYSDNGGGSSSSSSSPSFRKNSTNAREMKNVSEFASDSGKNIRSGGSSSSTASPGGNKRSKSNSTAKNSLKDTNAFFYIDPDATDPPPRRKYRCVAEYRSLLMVTTCTLIFAIDFPAVYPRQFGKLMYYGYSMMDLGVGGFVFCMALVGKPLTSSANLKEDFFSTFVKKVQSLSPLLVLGVGRFLSTWAAGYHVPAEEYGLHWNFFLTLAAVNLVIIFGVTPILKMFCSDSNSNNNKNNTTNSTVTNSKKVSILCSITFAIMFIHQIIILDVLGGRDYIFSADIDRTTSFFSANREGILSIGGFTSIYLLGAVVSSVGIEDFPLLTLALITGFLLNTFDSFGGSVSALSSGGSHNSGDSNVDSTTGANNLDSSNNSFHHENSSLASRRLCNMSYSLYVFSTQCFMLGLFREMDIFLSILKKHVFDFRKRKIIRENKSNKNKKSANLSPTNFDDENSSYHDNSVGDLSGSSYFELPFALPFFLHGIQDSLLAVFLGCNLLTGVLNMSVRSLLTPFWPGFFLLYMYCLLWMSVAYTAGRRGKVLKFW